MRKIAVAIAVLALMCGFAPSAVAADTYLSTVSSAMQTSGTHVWQDPSAPLISTPEVSQLEAMIVASGKPIYVAIVNQGKISSTNSSSFPQMFYDTMKRDGAYVVVGTSAFRAGGFNTSSAVASGAPNLATSVFNKAKANGATKPNFQMINDLVSGIAELNFTKPAAPATMPMTPQSPMSPTTQAPNLTWLWWLLGILGVSGIVIGIFAWRAKRRRDEEDREEEKRAAYQQPRFEQPVTDNPSPEERATGFASSTAPRAQTGGSTYVTYNTYSNDHPYNWRGGMWGNQYYGPGYYNTDFTTGYLLGSMNNRDRNDDYHGSSSNTYTPAPTQDTYSSGADSGYGGGGDLGGSSTDTTEAPSTSNDSGYGGGGDFGSSSSDTSSDSGFGSFDASPSSSDSGGFGGFDSGSSGFDSGGGGGGGDF